jgi:alkylhydroperoxidase/carboxymuconolactone decarboxylase family protein YurZ
VKLFWVVTAAAAVAAAAVAATAARAQTPPPPAAAAAPSAQQPSIPTISTGAAVDLARHLQPEAPTVFLFFNGTSSADKELARTLTERAQSAGGRVALRLVRLMNLDAAAARQHGITETPTVLVLDRFGKTVARTSAMAEIDAAVLQALRMARIKWVDEKDPSAPEVFKNLGGGRAPVPGILKTMSLQPEWMDAIDRLSRRAVFSDTHLPRRTKEMIATYVSALNRCKY